MRRYIFGRPTGQSARGSEECAVVGGGRVSLAVAIPAGLALGASGLAYRVSRFSIDFLRTIPPVALIPLALLLYGATPAMALVLVIYGSVWPVLRFAGTQMGAVPRPVRYAPNQ